MVHFVPSLPQDIGGLQAILPYPHPPLRGGWGQGRNYLAGDNWQYCRSLDEAIFPVRSLIGSGWSWFMPLRSKGGVRRYRRHSGRLHREFVLLRLALSLTASLPYLSPAFHYAEDRLGKHDVAVAPKLFGLIKVPARALVFCFAALEDIAHTVKQWAIECDACPSPHRLLLTGSTPSR